MPECSGIKVEINSERSYRENTNSQRLDATPLDAERVHQRKHYIIKPTGYNANNPKGRFIAIVLVLQSKSDCR